MVSGASGALTLGSPPRMRGKHLKRLQEIGCVRITPAHAGKTSGSGSGNGGCADHPRACGENFVSDSVRRGLDGSPPRMRGKLLHSVGALVHERITPAHAGKTDLKLFQARLVSDHPRACGENPAAGTAGFLTTGSPPRMRGKHYIALRKALCQRITPAHAGKTNAVSSYSLYVADHPRACGENII